VQEGTVLEPKFEILESLAKQLAPYSNQEEVEKKVRLLRKAYDVAQTDSLEQLDQMEQTVEEWKECHDGMDVLKGLIEHAKQSLDTSDTNLSLEEMLEKQEVT
jgi:phage shock protein A